MILAGMIGGIAPESSVQYYRIMIDAFRARAGTGEYPPILINSIHMTRMLRAIEQGDLPGVTDYLAEETDRLARAGAGFAFFASNTPHIVFDAVRAQVSIPMLSIVRVAVEAAKALGLRSVGLLGTRFTMQADFYPRAFAQEGIALLTPNVAEQDFVHQKYMGELVEGVFRPQTRTAVMDIALRMQAQGRIEGLVLGGTELPLLLDMKSIGGMPVLDTTRLHAEAATAWIFDGPQE